MTLLPILLLVGASADAWVAMPGDSPTCGSAALTNAVHVLRPQLQLHPGDGPPTNLQILLNRDGDHYLLQLRGPEVSLDRVIPDRGGCEEAVRTAALIVDAALDEISRRGSAPGIDTLAPPKPPPPLEAGFAVGGGAEQGLLLDFDVRPTVNLDLQFNFGLLEFGLSGEFISPESKSLPGGVWKWQVLGGAGEVVLGVAPHLGPGRFFADAVVGLTLTTVSVTGSGLFHVAPATDGNAVAGLRAGYEVNLPFRLFIAGRAEERYAFSQSGFDVIGEPSGVTTRVWTLVGTLVLGWRFF